MDEPQLHNCTKIIGFQETEYINGLTVRRIKIDFSKQKDNKYYKYYQRLFKQGILIDDIIIESIFTYSKQVLTIEYIENILRIIKGYKGIFPGKLELIIGKEIFFIEIIMEDKVVGFNTKNKKNKNTKIEIITYENRKNLCTQFCFANTKKGILENFITQLSYLQVKELVLLLDNMNMKDYKQKKIAVRVDDTNCEHT